MKFLLLIAVIFIPFHPIFAQDAILKFDEKVQKLGKVKQNINLKFTYHFKNEGSVPLIINNTKVSCSCTVPVWPSYPILPGEKDSITVSFKTNGKYGYQDRDIEVLSNAKKSSTFISFRCNVIEQKKH